MTLMKSALLASATTIIAVASAQAADLPSKKAAPVSYVKVCDAYGAGFFNIPGTDTCVKLGGYVRAEYQYVPGKDVKNASGAVTQSKKNMSETGYEVRGRIDVDARTPTAAGPARTFIRLRAANTSGVRNANLTDRGTYSFSDNSATGITAESALVQWAGFTFGVAPENYAMMPSSIYHANPWTGFPSGMKQIAYTRNFGGGLTATIALEDRKDFSYDSTKSTRPETAANIVGNVRLDQSWGFAAVHGMVGNNSVGNDQVNGTNGQKTYSAFAVGTTVSFKLPMIAPGDQLWLNANYADGILGALLTGGGLSAVNRPANGRLLGGLLRVDTSLVQTGGTTNAASTTNVKSYDNTTGWNVGGQFTHYWSPQWRSNFVAGYVEFNPPTSKLDNIWGKGQLQNYVASLVYSPVRDLDIGIEVAYASLKSKMQNAASFDNANPPVRTAITSPAGLNENNLSVKFRVERSF
jgi:hypothetical protein